jgi:hypothetical protein
METWYANTSETYSRSPCPKAEQNGGSRARQAPRARAGRGNGHAPPVPGAPRGGGVRRDGYFTVTIRYIPSRSCPSMKHTSAYLPFFANETSW